MNVAAYLKALQSACDSVACHDSVCDDHASSRQVEHDDADARVMQLHEQWVKGQGR